MSETWVPGDYVFTIPAGTVDSKGNLVSAPKERTWEQIQAEDLTLCAKDKPCVWTEDMDTLWESSCASNGGPFQFTDEGPTENHFAFCPYCGHPLLAVKYIETLREEEAQ